MPYLVRHMGKGKASERRSRLGLGLRCQVFHRIRLFEIIHANTGGWIDHFDRRRLRLRRVGIDGGFG